MQEYREQLTALAERAQKSMDALERERGYVTDTMQKIQGSFGNQREGQKLVMTLYEVNNALAAADSSLAALRSRVESYIRQTEK